MFRVDVQWRAETPSKENSEEKRLSHVELQTLLSRRQLRRRTKAYRIGGGS